MNEDEKDREKDEKDQELSSWLRLWQPPLAPARLDERVKASYRSASLRASPWKRVMEVRISLSLPVALLMVGLALGMGVLAGNLLSRGRPAGEHTGQSDIARGGGLESLRPLPEVRLTVLKQGGERND